MAMINKLKTKKAESNLKIRDLTASAIVQKEHGLSPSDEVS